MANPRFHESRRFGPSLEWESLPVVGQPAPQPINWSTVAVGAGAVLFWAIVGLVIVIVS